MPRRRNVFRKMFHFYKLARSQRVEILEKIRTYRHHFQNRPRFMGRLFRRELNPSTTSFVFRGARRKKRNEIYAPVKN